MRTQPASPWPRIAEAIAREFTCVREIEHVSCQGAHGRILAQSLFAAQSLPGHTHAVMDGYALGALPPGSYQILADAQMIGLGQACHVAAGSSIPHGTVGVVLADHATQSDNTLHVRAALIKDNIRRAGEEAQAGDRLLDAGIPLNPRHIALALAAGVQTIPVLRRLRIALAGLHDHAHGLPHLGIARALLMNPAIALTEAGAVRPAMLEALLQRLSQNHDLVIVVAESLGGEEGLLARTLAHHGESTVHRAAMKPAKPVVTGKMGESRVIGLAGTAYAMSIAAHLFLRPALQKLLALETGMLFMPAVSGFDRARKPGRAEALPVRISSRNGLLEVTSAGRFGQLRALAGMDGFALIEADEGVISRGKMVSYWPLSFPL